MNSLVTVAITTYNSTNYVLETLESIYSQTYKNIALVVSDDYSTDSTITVVNNWLAQEKNHKRFVSVELITVEKNTGVSANCNRCIAASSSNWIKFIAGDDLLLPNCIEDNMNFVANNPEANIIFSQVKMYQDDFRAQNYIKTTPLEFPHNLMDISFTAKDQYQLLLKSDKIHYTPSYFFNKKATLKVGGYNENNRLVEDYPMWLQLTKAGEKLYYFHKPTVGYRIHKQALNNVGDQVIFKPSVLKSHQIRKQYAHPYLPWEIAKLEQHTYWISTIFQKFGWNKKTTIYNIMYKFATVYLNPFQYMYAIKKRVYNNSQFYS